MSTLIISTVEVSVVLAGGLVVVALLRHRSAGVRHWVLATAVVGAWLTLGVGIVVPAWQIGSGAPAWSLPRWADPGVTPLNFTDPADTQPSAPSTETRSVLAPSQSVESSSGVGGSSARLGQMVFWVWVTGAGANILLLLVGLVRLRLLRAGAEQLFSGPWRKLADEVSRTTGCRRRVELWQSAHPAFLMTWGWIRPRILLPTGAGTWSEERIRVVLGHEVAHIARGDWALQLLSECLRSLHWFNPLTWLVSAWLQRESERACDDVVLSLGTEGTTFATHLVALARAARQRRHGWFPAAAMAQPSNLERRVSAMLNVECKRNQVSRRSRTATALAFALVAVLVAGLTGVAQSASVAGEILDQTGRPIPEASVTLIDRDSQDRQTTEADASGRFEIVDVTPSDYSLIIGRPGFAQFFQRLEINSGEQLEESFSLELGSVEETITVTDAVPSQTPVVRTASPNRRRRQRGNRPQGGQIQPPIKVRDVAAVYPESLRDSGFDGTVVLDAVIKTNGFVEILQILAPVDPVSMVAVDPDVPRAAVEAVEQWRYEPTRLHDVPVDTPVSISVRFRPSE